MKKWERVHHPSENVLEKPFTYIVDDVGEEPTTCQRRDAPHAVMEKQQPLESIHGRQRTLKEKGYVENAFYSSYLKLLSL